MSNRTPLYTWAGSAAIALVVGCSSSSSVTTPLPPTGTTANLTVTVGGLPSDVPAAVVISGPAGYTRTITATTALTGLAAGSYTIAAPAASNVGIGYAAATPAPVTLTAGQTGTSTVAYAIQAFTARATANRTDENTSPKYHLLYVLPSDGVDRGLDTNGTITRTVSSFERWYASQASGSYLRFDTSNGALDITFVRTSRTDATLTGYGDFIRDTLEKDLRVAGYTTAANTLYLAYYDGGHQSRCGSAAGPPQLPGVLGVMFIKGRATTNSPCINNPFAATPTALPGYFDFVAAHEALHLLGIVSAAAPNYVTAHVNNDPTDLMYAGSLAWRPAILDITKTNYYNPNGLGAGVTNLANSPYLTAPTVAR